MVGFIKDAYNGIMDVTLRPIGSAIKSCFGGREKPAKTDAPTSAVASTALQQAQAGSLMKQRASKLQEQLGIKNMPKATTTQQASTSATTSEVQTTSKPLSLSERMAAMRAAQLGARDTSSVTKKH